MRHTAFATLIGLSAIVSFSGSASAQTWGLAKLSEESEGCLECHRTDEAPSIYQQWGLSKHFRANIGCYECHAAEEGDADAFEHSGLLIATIVSPKDCGKCHEREATEFAGSHHAKAAQTLGSPDDVLAELVEGNHGMVTPAFPKGNSSAAVSGCWQCHGSQVKVLGEGKLDPATWPNNGIGRINPDGSEGSCTACHARHTFSVEQARQPDNCGTCHTGPAHPQKEVFYESQHGVAYLAHKDELHMGSAKWVVSEDYCEAPTCATCHMSATKDQPVTHDVGMRISWNNRPAISVRPEVTDKALGLPGASVGWQTRRGRMKEVCLNCHKDQWVDNFYTQYDSLIELYRQKFAEPGLALYTLAKKAKASPGVAFTHDVDWAWFELWHQAGRRARQGTAMMGPDYTQWRGMYDVARGFYAHYVPALRALIGEAQASGDARRIEAAKALQAKLDEVLSSDDHKWFSGKMDPEDASRRQKVAEDFKARYKD